MITNQTQGRATITTSNLTYIPDVRTMCLMHSRLGGKGAHDLAGYISKTMAVMKSVRGIVGFHDLDHEDTVVVICSDLLV